MEATPTLLRNAAWAVLWDAAARCHVYGRDVDIPLRDGRIAAIAPHADRPVDPDVTVIERRRLLAMAGPVNVHTHTATAPAYRGVREDHGVPEHHMSGLFERWWSSTRCGIAADASAVPRARRVRGPSSPIVSA